MVIARLLCPLLFVSSVMAGQLGIDNHSVFDQDVEALDQIKADSQKAVLNQLQTGAFDWVKEAEQGAFAEAQKSEKPVGHTKIEDAKGTSFVVYVSWSLGEAFIKSLIEEYASSENVVLKFRGIPDGATMIQGLTKIQSISMATKSGATVELDPVSFQENGIEMVPAVVRFVNGKRENIALGTASIEVFKGKEKTPSLGVVGSQLAILEKDMIEMMKERAAKIDWSKKKEQAIGRFWAGQNFIPLEEAQEHRIRRLDPTVEVPQDMKTADGKMIQAAGTLINPLSIRPFNQRLVIIDPTKPWQLTLAREQIDHFGQNQLVTIIMTQLDRDTAWDDLKAIEESLGQAAYILPPDVKERFDIQLVPAVVTADKSAFFIEEFAKRDR